MQKGFNELGKVVKFVCRNFYQIRRTSYYNSAISKNKSRTKMSLSCKFSNYNTVY